MLYGLVHMFYVYMFNPRPGIENWHATEIERALELGRVYAWSLLWGDKERLLEMSVSPASQKIEGANLEELPIYGNFDRIWDSWGIPEGEQGEAIKRYIDILDPLIFTEESESIGRHKNLDLLMLEKLDCSVVMTFAYRVSREAIVEIPGKGKMLFAVAMKYYQPESPKPGTWVVFDYHYRGTLADYREWVLKEGRKFADTKSAESKSWFADVETVKALSEKIERQLELTYEWGSARTKGQLDDIESLHSSKQVLGETF